MKLTQEQIEEIRGRLDYVTSGPWDIGGMNDKVTSDSNELAIAYDIMNENDAAFIANARQDVPALLDRIEELQELAHEILSEYHFWKQAYIWARSESIGEDTNKLNDKAAKYKKLINGKDDANAES
ncbi:hypothetical protein [Priestia megaterium]|uniref:hypothetical protein n=1 Tax=Priestia megaterium TaxID=1404 RepID=UPI001DF366CC|nr:hypothetical protein [Priestia megaterium]CAH0305870.1 hypothetical protein SRABI82_04726 [Priestia megaterium]